jgi:hypothetical protein
MIAYNEQAGCIMTHTRMQWFFLILLALWIGGAMTLPIVAFCLTGNPLCFSFFGTLAPPVYILHRIAGFLFPKQEKDYELAALKIKHLAQKKLGHS